MEGHWKKKRRRRRRLRDLSLLVSLFRIKHGDFLETGVMTS
jgi:hypothetical protein